jgi:anti-sigma regulatory factor (Ser/Thr protein kinase)
MRLARVRITDRRVDAMAKNDFEIRMLFCSRADARARARSVVETLLASGSENAFTADDVDEILLGIQECLTNIARHAYDGAERPVELAVAVGPGGFRATIRDRGARVAPERLTFSDPATQGDGGRGLFLLKRTMDGIEYGREGTANVVRLRRAVRR